MADNMIELVASLNVTDSAEQINRVDIPKLQKKIEGIKIKCELDADGITSIQTQLNSISRNLKMQVPKIDMGLTGGGKDVINNVEHLADSVEKRISELKQNLAKEFGVDVNRIITNTVKNAQDQITSFSFDLTKLSGKVEKFNYEVSRKKDGDNVITTVKQTSSRDSDKGAIELLKKRNAEIDKLTQKLEKLRAGYSDQNDPRPILNEENILKLNNEFDETNKVIKEIKYSTSETFTKMVSDANKAISKYEELGKALRNAENTATDFSSKDITSAKSLLGGRIDSFVTEVSKSNIDDPQSIIQQAEAIKKSFDAIGDSQGLKTARDNFNKLRGEFESLDAVAKKSTFDKNLSNKVRKLTDNINNYAAANQRAIKSNKEMSNGKSFADEWSRIISEMAKGAELSDQEIKQLNVDLQSFKKNAKTAGLEGASAFEKFGNSFKLISTYISANQIINTVINQIRNAVTELQTVDDRLTEISKTSDRSAESLRRLGQESFDAASQYGRTASDYLLGVQEMSRAGFGEQASEDMARLSVLAQAAGDMTADLSNQYLIATNAAYGYEGSVEKLNDVLDRQNYVTNHYALSMGDLAEATKIASSQAAQSGIGIDEMTAALSTMISTTQQGGEIASRALRGILMNIQQVKGEVGDGEEDITSDSLSKYEKAAAALGVALKEVRNGAVALRDPMVVLDELATAFNKEADDSVKKANLISSVGGKYRGERLPQCTVMCI